MTVGPEAAFQSAAAAAQAGAGIIAARHRGDLAAADSLLDDLSEGRRASGFLFLADLAVTLLAQSQDRPPDEVAAELSLLIADQAARIHGDNQ